MNLGKDVIIACDFASAEELYVFLEKLGTRRPFLKVGMELYYQEGKKMIEKLKTRGHKIFLDLKLHDIPNTVRKTSKIIGTLGVDMTNVHALGGIKMMYEARLGLNEGAKEKGLNPPILVAVTQLTSTDETMLKQELLIDKPMMDVVKIYAEHAKEAGLQGVVCSPLEAPMIDNMYLISVTPGIRLLGDDADDQKRVSTPEGARKMGSTYIVVGRSITGAEDPAYAYDKCMLDFCG